MRAVLIFAAIALALTAQLISSGIAHADVPSPKRVYACDELPLGSPCHTDNGELGTCTETQEPVRRHGFETVQRCLHADAASAPPITLPETASALPPSDRMPGAVPTLTPSASASASTPTSTSTSTKHGCNAGMSANANDARGTIAIVAIVMLLLARRRERVA